MQKPHPSTLPVMEHFYTLQGEGYWSGTPAYFVRLAGCDVGCVWCDVKDSWEVQQGQEMSVDEIVSRVSASRARRVVITGGEPLMYDLGPICKALHDEEFIIHLETSGAYPLKGGVFDWICLSPKKFKAALPEWFLLANELKVVVFNLHDLEWALLQAEKCDASRTRFYLQPEWSKKEELSPQILQFLKLNPNWSLSLQTHKYLNIP